MSNNKLGATQQKVLDHLRGQSSISQPTCEAIAEDCGLTKDQAKHALARLHAAGLVLRADGRPARYTAAPQVVNNPPQAHTAPLHGQMPTA